MLFWCPLDMVDSSDSAFFAALNPVFSMTWAIVPIVILAVLDTGLGLAAQIVDYIPGCRGTAGVRSRYGPKPVHSCIRRPRTDICWTPTRT